MKLDRRNFIIGSTLASINAGRIWAAASPLTINDASDDVEITRSALKLHPGLYRYSSPAQIGAGLDELRLGLASGSGLNSHYIHLSRFLSRIRCGHTYANFLNQKKAVATELFDRPTKLPFQFVWLTGAMIVTDDPSGQLPAGSVIERLNGRLPGFLLRELMPLVRADGHNDAKRVSLLEVQGTEKIETFDVFQGMLAPPAAGVHLVSAQLPNGISKTLELPAATLAYRTAHMRMGTQPAADGALWTWQMRSDGIALLTMPTWALYNSKWDWRGWLGDRLDSLGGAKGLIVDLRDNEGGQDCGDEILARLISSPYTPPKQEQRIRFERTPVSLDKYLDTWDDSFRTLGVGARPLANGFYLRPGEDKILSIEPAKSRIKVPVVVLTSPVNSSATFQFAQNFREISGGKLVGQTTGGNRRGINGGCFFFVRLPATGLEFDLPLVGQFPLTPQPDAGLVPDVIVQRSRSDIQFNRDRALERAVELV